MVEQARIEAAERRLLADLPKIVGSIALPNVLLPFDSLRPTRQVSTTDYELWTVRGNTSNLEPNEQLDSLAPADYDYSITPDPGTWHCLCLDCRDAIALATRNPATNEKHLTAFASAGISHVTGAIHISQIQGTHSNATNPTTKRGRGGIRWGETLVLSWATVGRELGLETIQISRPASSDSPSEEQANRIRRMITRHEEIASFLGFVSHGSRWSQYISNLV